jgi:hypothetical protein
MHRGGARTSGTRTTATATASTAILPELRLARRHVRPISPCKATLRRPQRASTARPWN